VAIDVRRPPKRLNVPSFSCAGPEQDLLERAVLDVCTARAARQRRVERRHPPVEARGPGASWARRSGEPIMTASAPQAIALETSPPVRIPPSAMTWTYSPVSSMCVERAPATSAMAVACGTPTPRTPRVVHAWPGPTPTRTPRRPCA
jgi:hypothetical protein